LAGWKELRRTTLDGVWINAVAVTPDGSSVLLTCADGTIRSWNLSTGERGRSFATSGNVQSVKLSSDGRWLYGVSDKRVDAWDLTADEWATIAGPAVFWNRITASADARVATFLYSGEQVRLIDLPTGR